MKRSTFNATKERGSADLPLLVAFCLLFLCTTMSFVYFSLFGDPPVNGEKTLQKTIETASLVKYYSADVFIQPNGSASSSDIISGVVAFDLVSKNGSGSFSAPLIVGKATPRIDIETLSFSDATSTYAKFRLKDVKGESVLAFPEEWTMISDEQKGPDQFAFIKDSSVLANIFELFQKGGKYLVVNGIAEKQIGGTEPEIHFALRPSQIDSDHPTGVSKSFDTLLKEGNVNVWVSAKDKSIREVRFGSHGYLVTVKIKNSGNVVAVKKPENALSLFDWKAKQFSSFVLKEPVSEIFIGSYGTINKEYLDAISSAIKRETGIKATVLLPGPALPTVEPLYDAKRGQFDAVSAFESVKNASLKYGDKARFVYLLDVNTYSSEEKSRDSVWYADEIGSNTTIVSIYGLRKQSDVNTDPASQSLVIDRAQKIALHVLGTSVGFGLSPSTENPTCLMYKTNSLAELDKEGLGYCTEEKSVIKKFFGK